MKLVDILARELSEWPEADLTFDSITQDFNGLVNSTDRGRFPQFEYGEWSGVYSSYLEAEDGSILEFEISEDYSTAIITKEMWQEARNNYLNVEEGAEVNGELKVGDVARYGLGSTCKILSKFVLANVEFAVVQFDGEDDPEIVNISALSKYKSPQDIQQETKQAHVKRIKEYAEYSGEYLKESLERAYDAGFEEGGK